MGRKKERQAPVQKRNESWLCNLDAFTILTSSSYTKLADCPEVKMCVNVYADLISSMTIYLMENTDLGDVRVKNELSRKMDIEPNKYMTRKTYIYNLVWTLLLTGEGNQVTYPKYDEAGLLDSLVPLKPAALKFKSEGDGYFILNGDKRLNPDEVLHFVINPDPECPWKGTGYQAALGDVLKGLKQAATTKKALMESPAPSLVVKVDGLTEEFSTSEGRQKLGEQYLSSSENGRPWFIPSEAFALEQIKPLTIADLAISENVTLDKRTVAGIFRMPPFLVGVGNYNKEEYNNFITSAVMPMAKGIEQEFTRKILYSDKLYWKFNPRSLYAYDISEIIAAGSQMVDRMAMRRNEWRDWVGMSPDPEMQDILALENFIPADKLGDQNKLNGGDKD